MITSELAPVLVTLKGAEEVNGPWTTTSAPTEDEVVTPSSSDAGNLYQENVYIVSPASFCGKLHQETVHLVSPSSFCGDLHQETVYLVSPSNFCGKLFQKTVYLVAPSRLLASVATCTKRSSILFPLLAVVTEGPE